MFSLNQKVMQRDEECLTEVVFGCHSRMVNEPQLSRECWWHEGEDSRTQPHTQQGQTDGHWQSGQRARGRSSARARGRKGKGTVALQPEARIRGSHNSLRGCHLTLGPHNHSRWHLWKQIWQQKCCLSRLTVGNVYKHSAWDLNLTKDRNWADFSLLPVKKWESVLEKLDGVHCFSGLCVVVKSNCSALSREMHKYWPSKWAAISLLRMPGV